MGWLNQLERIRSMVLMFQKEVGDRIVAEPGSKAYGRLAVITQWLCEVRRAFDLPPGAFIPPPKVSSSVIVFIPRSPIPAIDERKRMSQLTAAAFGQRRKMLRASLKSFTDDPEILLRNAGIDPTLRAENLFLEDFLRILASERQL